MARWNSVSYVVAVAARWTKSLKFTLSIAIHRGGPAKNHFWLVAKQKKRIGEQLNYFWNMCPKPFSWAKNKRKFFFVGKLRGMLLARVALKLSNHKSWITNQSYTWLSVPLVSLFISVLTEDSVPWFNQLIITSCFLQ